MFTFDDFSSHTVHSSDKVQLKLRYLVFACGMLSFKILKIID
jgi:hypothetical protein